MTSPTFRRHTGFAASALASVWLANSSPAAAADIYVLSASAMQPVFNEIVDHFERMTEHKVIIRYATMNAFTRTLPDERADLVISSRQYISELARQGRIRPDIQLTICKIGVEVVASSDTANAPMTPAEPQDHTVISAAVPKDAPESGAVSAFLAFLTSAKAVAVMKAKGMEAD